MSKRSARPAPVTSAFSDIDLTRWKDYESVFTDSLWLFESRSRANGHSYDYHGNYIPQIATQILTRFTRQGDTIVDLFLGSGTTAIEAATLGRRCIGIELQPKLVSDVRRKLRGLVPSDAVAVLQGNSASESVRQRIKRKLHQWDASHAQLVMLHPPYDDIIQFSANPDDLSNCPTTDEFLDRFGAVAQLAFDVLEHGRFAVLIIGDKYADGELVPLGFRCLDKMNEAGFRTKSIVVKNIEGNERGKGRTGNLWRYRALRNGFYIFKHEYVMVFFKPHA
jgi:16S rRNA G966 N2-methylase RsmD